jgi:hypothetical protein
MNSHAAARSCRQAVKMKARIETSSSRMTRKARPIWWAAKKVGDHRKFSKSCAHHSHIGQPLASFPPDAPAGDGDQHIEHHPDRSEQPVRRIEAGLAETGTSFGEGDLAGKDIANAWANMVMHSEVSPWGERNFGGSRLHRSARGLRT